MKEDIKINHLGPLEGIPVKEKAGLEKPLQDSGDHSKIETPAETEAKLADIRDVISGKMIENPLVSMKDHLESFRGFYQLFNSDRPDLSDHIRTVERQLRKLDELIVEFGKIHLDELRDKLLELKGVTRIFLKAAEESKIGEKAWFSGDVMKNRDTVAFLSQELHKNFVALCEEVEREVK